MKMPSLPKLPNLKNKLPKVSVNDIKEHLPFQRHHDFVMYDSEHPEDGAEMEYRPSTGYPVPPVQEKPSAGPGPENGYDPFQRNMYPGGQARTPYAAGGSARNQYSGVWPPEPDYNTIRQASSAYGRPYDAQPDEYSPRNAVSRDVEFYARSEAQTPPNPVRPPYPPAGGNYGRNYPPYAVGGPAAQQGQAPHYNPGYGAGAAQEYYRPASGYNTQPYPQEPYGQPWDGVQPHDYRQAARPLPTGYNRQPTPEEFFGQTEPPADTSRSGFGSRVLSVARGILPGKKAQKAPKASRTPKPRAQQPESGPYSSVPQAAPRTPRKNTKSNQTNYYIWSFSIAAGLILTLVSFIYACAA